MQLHWLVLPESGFQTLICAIVMGLKPHASPSCSCLTYQHFGASVEA